MTERLIGWLCVLSLACAPVAAPTPTHVDVAAAVVEPEDPLRSILYEGQWGGWDVRLVGVDPAGTVAVVRLTDRSAPLRVVFDTVDLARGERVERWEASDACAVTLVRGDAVYTCVDGTAGELERYAEMLRRVGPWHTRGTLSHPVVAAGPQTVAFLGAPDEGDGDWILVESAGVRARVGSFRAAYDPVWSPDGTLVFRVCGPRPAGCAWSLWTLRGQTLRQLAPAPRRPPVLAADGGAAWIVTGRRADCLASVRLSDGAVAEAGCGQPDSRVRMADSGGAGVFFAPVDGGLRLWPLAGALLGEPVTLVGATAVGPVEAGRVALGTVDGAVRVVDLSTGRDRTVESVRGRYAGLSHARWTPRGLVVLETYDGGFSIVALPAH